MKILNETKVTKKLKEDYASRIVDLYEKNPEESENIIASFMGRIGKAEDWESPYYTNMNVDESINELLNAEQKQQLITELEGGSKYNPTPDAVVEDIINTLLDDGVFNNVVTFKEAGLLTRNLGFVVTLGNKKFQFSLLGS